MRPRVQCPVLGGGGRGGEGGRDQQNAPATWNGRKYTQILPGNRYLYFECGGIPQLNYQPDSKMGNELDKQKKNKALLKQGVQRALNR